MSDSEGPRKICCCEQETFIKILNMGVAVAMIIIGFVNMFKIVSILSAKAQIIMLTSFIVYQM
jgi:hypothetical protein